MAMLGWFTLLTILGNAFAAAIEYTTDKPQIIKGPRNDLNETGRFLFPHPHTGDYLLCKNCSTRALYNGQYKNEQEVLCINKNYGKMEPYTSFDIYPYCKIGSDLVCGNPPFKGKNSYWVCFPAYSPTNYSVYSTCQLICNTTNAVIGQTYCSENLTWYEDQYPEEECKQPVSPDKGPTDETGPTDSTKTILLVCGLAIAVIVVAVVVICLCYRRKKRLSRPPSADNVENRTGTSPEEIPLNDRSPPLQMDMGNSIGDCSIDDGVSERSELLPANIAQPLKVHMSTSTSTLDTCGQNGGQLGDSQDGIGQGAQSGLGVSNRSTSSQTDDGHHVQQLICGASSTFNSSNTDNGHNGQGNNHQNGENRLSDNSTETDGSEVGQSRQGPSGTSGSSSTGSVQRGQGNRSENRQIGLTSSSISSCSRFYSEHRERENEAESGHPCEQQIGLTEPGESVGSRSSNRVSEQENGQNGLRSSGRSSSSQINSQPYLKMFPPKTDSESRCESGLNKLQEKAYSVQTGSSFYFVPSQTNVVEVKICRKGEGHPFRGTRCIGPNNFVLENVTLEDAGLYIYTITWEASGEIKSFTDSFEIFVADTTNQIRDIGEPCQTSHVVNQKIQRSTVVEPSPPNQLNQAESSQDNTSGNTVTSGRVPPEGAENDAPQASGQGHPKFNGARPKTRHILGPTVVSGASIGGVKDPQPTMSNNLDLSQITSGVEKTKLNNMNISTGLPSVEDNRLTESLNVDLKSEIAHAFPGSNLDFSSVLSSKGNPSYSQQNDLNTVENTDNISNTSVELTSVELDKLKAHELDLSEILDSTSKTSLNDGSNSSIQNPVEGQLQLSEDPRSLSHLQITTLEQASHTDWPCIQTTRPDPSGRCDQPQVIEDNGHETEPKVIYRQNEGVRGEQTADDSSVLNQPQAHVRFSSDRISRGQRSEGQETRVEGIPSDLGQIGEPRGELNETVQGAVGGVPILDGMVQQRLDEQHGACQCITLLKDLKDTDCLQNVCWLGNPREKNPDAKTWFGLCSFYNHERHKLDAIAYALRTDPYNGPMYHALTKLLAQQNLTVGHVVYYYTLETSYNPEIVERLVDKCPDHINCKYCQDLSDMAKLRYQSH